MRVRTPTVNRATDSLRADHPQQRGRRRTDPRGGAAAPLPEWPRLHRHHGGPADYPGERPAEAHLPSFLKEYPILHVRHSPAISLLINPPNISLQIPPKAGQRPQRSTLFQKSWRLDCPEFSKSPLGFSLSGVGNTGGFSSTQRWRWVHQRRGRWYRRPLRFNRKVWDERCS